LARSVEDIDMKLWLLAVSVAYVDRTIKFYLQVGFVREHDHR
jgi:hypothetical protein